MKKKTVKLKPCPFCESKDITMYKVAKVVWICQCEDCYASTRSSVCKALAMRHWNRRAK